MKKYLPFIVIIFTLPSIASCASIMTGRYQKIPVITHPSEARVTCASQIITTPGELTLLRGEGPYTVTVTKEGYWEEKVILKKTLSGATAGNALIGGLIGVGVDAATGAMYKLVPEEINIELKPLAKPLESRVSTEQLMEIGDVSNKAQLDKQQITQPQSSSE